MTDWKWDKTKAEGRIQASLDALQEKDISILELTARNADVSLHELPTNKAVKVNAAHIYIDILNIDEMFETDSGKETVTCHRKVLRFLNLHQRATHHVLAATDVVKVDFHNQRLHAVVVTPLGDEATRIKKAIAVSKLIKDVLAEITDADEIGVISAKVRIGIDSGLALAVNNGRRGDREPLFLGHPANYAAHLAGHSRRTGIYLSSSARATVGFDAVDNDKEKALTSAEIKSAVDAVAMGLDKDDLIERWEQELKEHPLRDFEFSSHTPPFKDLDLEELTPKNSRRQDAVSVYADIDGFTRFVRNNIDESPKKVVRALHVIRKELDEVLRTDFGGRKIRFIGDCIHGVLVEGTAQNSDAQRTVSVMTLCAGGMRSSFNLCRNKLEIAQSALGIGIGFEYGPLAITRLGVKGSRNRCAMSRGVLAAEEEQKRCASKETAIGEVAFVKASKGVQELFGDDRLCESLTYPSAIQSLQAAGDEVAEAAADVRKALGAAYLTVGRDDTVRAYAKLER